MKKENTVLKEVVSVDSVEIKTHRNSFSMNGVTVVCDEDYPVSRQRQLDKMM